MKCLVVSICNSHESVDDEEWTGTIHKVTHRTVRLRLGGRVYSEVGLEKNEWSSFIEALR